MARDDAPVTCLCSGRINRPLLKAGPKCFRSQFGSKRPKKRCRYFARHLFVAGASDAVIGASMGDAGLQSQALMHYLMRKTG